MLKGALGAFAGWSLPLPAGRAFAADGPTVTKIADRVALVSGAGGNVLALDTGDGGVLVDSGAAAASDALLAALGGLPGGARVRTLFNTHWHLDQVGSNAVLGRALVDRDRGVRTIAESGIRELWCRIGSRHQQEMLREVSDLNDQRLHTQAARLATELIHSSPWIAEAWCQRGTAHYHLGQYDAAIRDCHQALEINPYHFTAAAGMGQCYMLQDNPVAALEAFRRALRLNPGLEEVRAQVVRLQRSLKKD